MSARMHELSWVHCEPSIARLSRWVGEDPADAESRCMTRYVTTIESKRSPAQAFAYTADFSNALQSKTSLD